MFSLILLLCGWDLWRLDVPLAKLHALCMCNGQNHWKATTNNCVSWQQLLHCTILNESLSWFAGYSHSHLLDEHRVPDCTQMASLQWTGGWRTLCCNIITYNCCFSNVKHPVIQCILSVLILPLYLWAGPLFILVWSFQLCHSHDSTTANPQDRARTAASAHQHFQYDWDNKKWLNGLQHQLV